MIDRCHFKMKKQSVSVLKSIVLKKFISRKTIWKFHGTIRSRCTISMELPERDAKRHRCSSRGKVAALLESRRCNSRAHSSDKGRSSRGCPIYLAKLTHRQFSRADYRGRLPRRPFTTLPGENRVLRARFTSCFVPALPLVQLAEAPFRGGVHASCSPLHIMAVN